MMGWYGGMGWGAGMFMGVFWLALLAVIIYLVVRLLPSDGQSGLGGPRRESPEDILDRRFARGEIDLENYQAQRSALVAARAKR